jgi:hypothetical protein
MTKGDATTGGESSAMNADQTPSASDRSTTGTGGAIALSCSLIALVITAIGILFLVVLLPLMVS